MNKQFTQRGFGYYEFTTDDGDTATVKKSSSAMKDYIWIGAKNLKVKHFKADQGWNDIVYPNSIEELYVGNERLHLNQEQVAELIPILQKFVDTGEI